MPRDGSGVYSQPYPDVVSGTTIESAKYNGNVNDVEQDLNTPRPIVAGGTGAANAHDAMIALSGEIAAQLVDNYDTFPFVNGTFYSAPGATSAPTGNWCVGWCYRHPGAGWTIYLEARDMTNNAKYMRTFDGTWHAWAPVTDVKADLDAAYVNVAGDTMTGSLIVGQAITVDGYQPGFSFHFGGGAAGSQRMSLLYDDGTIIGAPGIVVQNQLDAGGFVSNSGVLWRDGALSLGDITRPNGGAGGLRVASTTASSSPATGALTVAGGVGVGGALYANGVVQASQLNLTSGPVTAFSGNYHVFYGPGSRDGLFIGDTANTANLNIYRADSHAFQDRAGAATKGAVNVSCTTASTSPTTGALTVAGGVGVGGALNVSAEIKSTLQLTTANTATTGTLFFGASYTKYLSYDGSNFNFAGGGVNVAGNNITATGFVCSNMANCYWSATSTYSILQFFASYAFSIPNATGLLTYTANNTAAFTSNFNGDFTVGNNAFKPGGGTWTATSDARIKNELGEYTRGLAEIVGLRPVYYTYKGNDTTSEPAHIKQEDIDSKAPLAVPYPNSAHIHPATNVTKYAGLIAQEVEAVFPEMVTQHSGYIDGVEVSDLRQLDTTPLIFALINAVKELKARVEQLEAA